MIKYHIGYPRPSPHYTIDQSTLCNHQVGGYDLDRIIPFAWKMSIASTIEGARPGKMCDECKREYALIMLSTI